MLVLVVSFVASDVDNGMIWREKFDKARVKNHAFRLANGYLKPLT